ncbi:zinc metalloprotease HtpX [Thermoproteota archaeon]
MSLLKLRLSMLATVSVIIAISTLGLALILSITGQLNVMSLVILMIAFNLAQWLLAPKLINAIYKTQRLTPEENPRLNQIVEELSRKSDIRTPKLMLANLPIPNAFAYGSPLTGNHVALTRGLVDNLNTGEVEAVIGHELGHIKHRDVQVMMFISFLPSLFYIIARSSLFSRYGGRDRRDSGSTALIGGAAMFIYFILLLFNLSLSRLRECYADQHSSSIVQDGAAKLSSGLAKITASTSAMIATRAAPSFSGYKALFISDPDKAGQDTSQLIQAGLMSGDDLVRNIMNRRITRIEKLGELFSTHPNIIKRLRAINQ